MNRRQIELYLNEHLAGAAAEIELAREVRQGVAETDPLAVLMGELLNDFSQEQALIRSLLEREGGSEEPPPDREPREERKPARQSWISAWLGRGEMPSPTEQHPRLARLLRLEGLMAARQWRLSLWEVLGTVHPSAEDEGIDFVDLENRIVRQMEDLASQRSRAAGQAFED